MHGASPTRAATSHGLNPNSSIGAFPRIGSPSTALRTSEDGAQKKTSPTKFVPSGYDLVCRSSLRQIRGKFYNDGFSGIVKAMMDINSTENHHGGEERGGVKNDAESPTKASPALQAAKRIRAYRRRKEQQEEEDNNNNNSDGSDNERSKALPLEEFQRLTKSRVRVAVANNQVGKGIAPKMLSSLSLSNDDSDIRASTPSVVRSPISSLSTPLMASSTLYAGSMDYAPSRYVGLGERGYTSGGCRPTSPMIAQVFSVKPRNDETAINDVKSRRDQLHQLFVEKANSIAEQKEEKRNRQIHLATEVVPLVKHWRTVLTVVNFALQMKNEEEYQNVRMKNFISFRVLPLIIRWSKLKQRREAHEKLMEERFPNMKRPTVEELKKAMLFSDMANELLARMIADMRPKCFRKGDYIFHEGDIGFEMYIIDSGTVSILMKKPSRTNKRRNVFNATPIAEIGRGALVGEVALLEKEPRGASALCTTDVNLWTIGQQQFGQLLAKMSSDTINHVVNISHQRKQANLKLLNPVTEVEFLELYCFVHWPAAAVTLLIKALKPVNVERGALLYPANSLATMLYVLVSGTIEVFENRLSAPTVIGEVETLLNKKRFCAAKACETSTLYALPKEVLFNVALTNAGAMVRTRYLVEKKYGARLGLKLSEDVAQAFQRPQATAVHGGISPTLPAATATVDPMGTSLLSVAVDGSMSNFSFVSDGGGGAPLSPASVGGSFISAVAVGPAVFGSESADVADASSDPT